MRIATSTAAVSLWIAALLVAHASPVSGAATKEVLSNGLVVITSPAPTGAVVGVAVVVKATIADEPSGKAGLRQLLQQTMVRGSAHLSGDDLAAALDAIGASIEAAPALDYTYLRLTCLAQDLPRALELLAEILRYPTLTEGEFRGQREVALRYLESLQTTPFEVGQDLVRHALYGEDPYALPTQGTAESLAAITRADLADFHGRYYVPNNTIIAIAGAVPPDAALAAARRSFGDWQRRDLPPPTASPVRPLAQSTMQLRQIPVDQAYFMVGFGTGPATRASYPAMEVIRALLGRGIGSRLFGALRDGASGAYRAEAYDFALVRGGFLAAYVASDPRGFNETKDAIVHEFTRLRSELVSASELSRAQEYTAGTHILSHQKAGDRAFHLAWYEAIGLGWDFDDRYGEAVRAVTAQQIRAAAQRQFTRYALGLVLPQD
jgi:zinc protease